jgi:hypothetical protein
MMQDPKRMEELQLAGSQMLHALKRPMLQCETRSLFASPESIEVKRELNQNQMHER